MCQDIKCHFLYFKEGNGHSEGKIKCSTTTCLAGRSVLPSALNLKATQFFSTSLLSSRGRTSDLLVWSWIHQLLTPRGSKKLGARVHITSNNKQASNNQAQKLDRHFFLKRTTWEAGKAWVEQAKLMPSGSWAPTFLSQRLEGEGEKRSKNPVEHQGQVGLPVPYLPLIHRTQERSRKWDLKVQLLQLFLFLPWCFVWVSTGCQQVWSKAPACPHCQRTLLLQLICWGMASPPSACGLVLRGICSSFRTPFSPEIQIIVFNFSQKHSIFWWGKPHISGKCALSWKM